MDLIEADAEWQDLPQAQKFEFCFHSNGSSRSSRAGTLTTSLDFELKGKDSLVSSL